MPSPLIIPLVVAVGGGITGGYFLWRARRKRGELPPLPGGKALPPEGGTDVPAEDAEEAVDAAALIAPLLGKNDVAAFHGTASGDSTAKVARKAVKKIHPAATDQQVAAMRRAIGQSQYNRQVFGQPHEPGYFYPEGVSVDGAFNPKHEGIEVLRAGFVPRRNIDAAGSRIGTSQKWGAPWVPDINQEALRAGVSDFDILFSTAWDDGTSGLEPPPLFWDNAVARPPLKP